MTTGGPVGVMVLERPDEFVPAHLVCTITFQGGTDHDVAARFAALPSARGSHLDQDTHELTCVVLDAA